MCKENKIESGTPTPVDTGKKRVCIQVCAEVINSFSNGDQTVNVLRIVDDAGIVHDGVIQVIKPRYQEHDQELEDAGMMALGSYLQKDDDLGVVAPVVKDADTSKMGIIELKAYAKQFGVDAVCLAIYDFDSEKGQEAVKSISTEIVRQYRAVPVFKQGDTITVAVNDPKDMQTIDSIRYLTGKDICMVVAIAEDIDNHIAEYYPATPSVETMVDELTEKEDDKS